MFKKILPSAQFLMSNFFKSSQTSQNEKKNLVNLNSEAVSSDASTFYVVNRRSLVFALPAIENWAADVVAKTMTHITSYNCRRITGSIFMSQQSYGNAIDISMINGFTTSKNCEKQAQKACKHSTNIQTPATNAAHLDHLLLNKGMDLPC